MSKILFEPFKIKVVEPIPISSSLERRMWIREAGYNVFNLRADRVMIDLLTDSGTTALSQEQWAKMVSADESYAGSKDFFELEAIAQEIFQKAVIIPVHQGRGAEHLVFSTLVKDGDKIPSNGHFDTTSANIRDNGGEPVNLPVAAGLSPGEYHPFKGNIDLEKLARFLEEEHEKCPFVMLTITNNTGGGQPVSLENVEQTHDLCRRFKKDLFIDACRFAENSYFIKLREEKFKNCTPKEIAQKVFSYATLVTFSGKKDALANIGGLVGLDDFDLAERLKNRLVITEGFPTYGGLAGHDLAAMAQGLREVLDENYLRYRLRTIEWMVERLNTAGVPVMLPAGGHAVFLDASKFFPQISRDELPGIALLVELYVRFGIRGVELGTVAFGRRNKKGTTAYPALELVRLAMPRRVYTEAHAGYVVESIIELFNDRAGVHGYKFRFEAPTLRHFRSTFEPV